ncbi:MAG: hypothetical protein JXR63_10960 [Spirochaetales bacterium]|nr:hypothetical protein [Spirochaetales bacterium]
MKIQAKKVLWVAIIWVIFSCSKDNSSNNKSISKDKKITAAEYSHYEDAKNMIDRDIDFPRLKEEQGLTINKYEMSISHYSVLLKPDMKIFIEPENSSNFFHFTSDQTAYVLSEKRLNEKLWYLVATNELLFGWIPDENLQFDNSYYYTPEVLNCTDKSQLQNSFKVAKYEELNYLKRDKSIRRNGPSLIINVDEIKIIKKDEIGLKGPFYNIVEKINSRYYIFHKQYYEAIAFEIFDIKNNEQVDDVYSLPYYSPNKTRFLTFDFSDYMILELHLFKFENNDSINLLEERVYVGENEIHQTYKIANIEWQSDSEFKITIIDKAEQTNYYIRGKESNEKWQIFSDIAIFEK